MPFFFHLAAWLHAAALIGCFYVHGFWVSTLVFPEYGRRQWAIAPLLGALVQALLLAHLSYAGVAVSEAVWPLLLVSAALDGWVWWRKRQRLGVEWGYAALAGGLTMLFLMPYVLYNGYPFLGDSFMYDAISDFVREHGYFASAEPAQSYPWLSMMRYAQTVHLAMGASFTEAAAGELLRQDSPTVFFPVTAAFLYLSLCGLRLLLGNLGVLAGLLLYGTNVPLVLQPAAINVLRQVGGSGYLYLLAGLAIGSATFWQLGLALAGIVTFYPEFLPFAAVPIAVLLLWRRDPAEMWRWATAVWIAVILNLYGWLAAVQNVLFHWQAKPGFAVDASGADYAGMLAGGRGGLAAGLVVLAVAAWGWWRLEASYRVYAAAAVAFFGSFALYLQFGPHYSYGVYKNVLFSFYVIVVCLAAALQGKWRWFGVAAGLFALAVPVREFVMTDYALASDGAYQELRGPGKMLTLFRSVQQAGAPPQQRTLLAMADERLAKWFAYFYRGPVGLYFPGEYLNIARERPLAPTDTDFGYLLTANADTSLADDGKVVWRNELASLSRAQTMLTFGQVGWLLRDVGVQEASHTMGRAAEMLVYSPTGEPVQLVGVVNEAKCAVSLQGRPGGERNGTFWTSLVLDLAPGFTTLTLTTDCDRLRWESLTLVKPVRVAINLSREAGARQAVAGLTEDGWVLERGVRLRVPGAKRLRVTGEKADGAQALLVNGQRTELPPGRVFDVTISLPGGPDVLLIPEHVQAGSHGDARRLGVRLTRVEPLPT